MARGEAKKHLTLALVLACALIAAILLTYTPTQQQNNMAGLAVQTSVDAQQNQVMMLDEMSIQVQDVFVFTQMGFDDVLQTDRVFVKPEIHILNSNSQAVRVPEITFTLVDEQNNEYSRFSDDYLYVDQTIRFAGWLRSQETKTGVVVFEAEPSQAYILEVSTPSSSQRIQLTELTNIGVDTSLEDRYIEDMLEYEDELLQEEIGY